MAYPISPEDVKRAWQGAACPPDGGETQDDLAAYKFYTEFNKNYELLTDGFCEFDKRSVLIEKQERLMKRGCIALATIEEGLATWQDSKRAHSATEKFYLIVGAAPRRQRLNKED